MTVGLVFPGRACLEPADGHWVVHGVPDQERCLMTRRLDTPPPPRPTKRPPDGTTPPYTPGGVTPPTGKGAESPDEKTAPSDSYPPKRKP